MSGRRICVVTGSRAEYGILHRLLVELRDDARAELQLIVTGAHLSPCHGLTVREIEEDGFSIDARVDMDLKGDSPRDITQSMGRALIGFADALELLSPDILVVLGDRFEILAAAEAAMLARIPIAHIHGGEASEGQVDEAIRHALTKMAHYHFVAAEPYRRRVIQMGEQPDRVFTVGAPGLDALLEGDVPEFEAVAAELGFQPRHPLLLVTYHPVTLRKGGEGPAVTALLRALDAFPEAAIVFTGVNADMAGAEIERLIGGHAKRHAGRAVSVASLGRRRYGSVLRAADVVVGNSSSGLIEAPAAGTPTVNIGARQDGRLRAPSVIDCGEEADAIEAAIRTALSPAHQELTRNCVSPYSAGGASRRIKELITTLPLETILVKRFYTLEAMA